MLSRLRTVSAGFTVVELLIYSFLTVLVLTIVGALLMNGFTGEKVVRGLTGAANDGQLATQSVEQGVRNAVGMSVSTPATGDSLLIVDTTDSSGSYSLKCIAWYYSGTDHTIRTMTAAALIDATPTASELQGWSLLVEGVSPVDGMTMFDKLDSTLTLNFQVTAGDSAPVTFHSSTTSRTSTLEAAPCS